MAEYNVKLKIYGNGEHICKKCFHYAVCIYQRKNNPIIECSRFVDQSKEKVYGKWITTRTIMHDGEYYCNKCGKECAELNRMGKPMWNFCPNCSADMREAEGEDDNTE